MAGGESPTSNVRRRAARRDPARLPSGVELVALVLVLASLAFANAWRSEPSDVSTSRAGASESEPAGAEPAASPARPSPAAEPSPAPVDLAAGGALPVLERVPTDDRVVFVTIDDGLHRDPAALEFLERHDIPFTSFITVPMAREDPAFWHESQRIGGLIEAHTFDHADLTAVSAEQRYREVCGTHEAFTEMFGHQPTLFRPPYGTYDDGLLSTAGGCGYHAVVNWSGTANDGVILLQGGTLQPGDIVLMHWREDLVTNLEKLLELVEEQRFEIGLLEDYLPPGR